jgi:hypothetical protein
MHCVSLVFSVHEERGIANAQELHAILLHVRPEVIFLEVPAAAFGDFYLSRRRENLESEAVHLFLDSCPKTNLIPTDLPTPAREFFEDHEQLCMRVRDASPRYRQLLSLDRDRLSAYGFAYLNSDYCSQHWSDVRVEILDAVRRIGDPRWSEVQEAWDNTNELREVEMMRNIQEYCAQNSFERGVVLVGAAHRRSLIEKFRNQSEVNWSLQEFGGDA